MNDVTQDLMARGIELMAVQNYEAARDVFASVVAQDSHNVEGHINLGNAYACLEQMDEAIDSFQRVLILDNQNVDALYSLGCAYFVTGDYASAVANFNKVEQLGAATVEMYGILMAIFTDAEDVAQALRCANKAIRLAPLNGSLRVQKAQLYIASGHLDEAIITLHELQEILPDDAEGYGAEAEVQIEAGRYEDALKALDKALERFPEDASLYSLKARALNTMGRYAEALDVAILGQGLGDERARVVSELAIQKGVALGGLERVDESLQAFESSIGSDGEERAEAYFMMLNECLVLKSFDKAIHYADALRNMEDVEPRMVACAIFSKPFALEQQGRTEEAHELYLEAAGELRRITIVHPGLFEVHGYRALCHKALGEYDEALRLADHIISLDETDAAAYAMKRDILLAMGDEEEAEKMKKKVISLNPSFEFGE